MSDTVDYEVRRGINRLEHELGNVVRQIEMFGSDLNQVHAKTDETRSNLEKLSEDFYAFVNRSERIAIIQRSETKIGALQGELDHQFGYYKTVRNTATGLLQAYDAGIVAHETASAVSEELMLTASGYWLAPALVALAAWASDDQELCQRAIAESTQRDPEKNALFFALVTRRQNRMDMATRWLRSYLHSQNPEALGRDFAVVLEAASQGAFGTTARALIQETLADWQQRLLTDDMVSGQVALWSDALVAHAPQLPPTYDFRALQAICPEYPLLEEALESATKYRQFNHSLVELLESPTAVSSSMEDAVDDILDSLVSEYDEAELPLRRELNYHEAIVKHDGDLELAQNEAAVQQVGMQNRLDFLSLQSTSAIAPESLGVSRATQKVAMGGCSDWCARAIAAERTDNIASIPDQPTIHFDADELCQLPGVQAEDFSGRFSDGIKKNEAKLVSYWGDLTRSHLHRLRYDWRDTFPVQYLIGAGVVVLVAFLISWIAVLLVVLLGGALAFFYHLHKQKQAEEIIAHARDALEHDKQVSLMKLRAADAQLHDWREAHAHFDADADELLNTIGQFSTIDLRTSQYERRNVSLEVQQ